MIYKTWVDFQWLPTRSWPCNIDDCQLTNSNYSFNIKFIWTVSICRLYLIKPIILDVNGHPGDDDERNSCLLYVCICMYFRFRSMFYSEKKCLPQYRIYRLWLNVIKIISAPQILSAIKSTMKQLEVNFQFTRNYWTQ